MTIVKIIFVFIYLKMQELGKALMRFCVHFYKEWIKSFALSIIGILSFVAAVGLGILGICSLFFKGEVASWFTHCITQSDGNFLVGVAGASFTVGFIVLMAIALCWWGLDSLKSNWHYVPELVIDNWKRATQIVLGEKI